MRDLTRLTGFDWDEGNRTKNWDQHKVAWPECEEVFFREPLLVDPDPAHSESEERFHLLGRTVAERWLFIVFTVRKNKIRIISARDMSKKERRAYNEAIEKDTTV